MRARRLVAPAFAPRRLAAYTAGFAERAEAHVDRWSDGEVLEMRQQMARLTLDIVGSTLLGIDLRDDAEDVRAALESALESFGGGAPALPLRRRGGPRASASGQASPPGGPRGAGLRAQVDAIVTKIVEARRDNPSEDRGDVVSALLAATAGPDGLTTADRAGSGIPPSICSTSPASTCASEAPRATRSVVVSSRSKSSPGPN